jgi:hypothetical protein
VQGKIMLKEKEINKMKNKKYHTVRRILKSNIKNDIPEKLLIWH